MEDQKKTPKLQASPIKRNRKILVANKAVVQTSESKFLLQLGGKPNQNIKNSKQEINNIEPKVLVNFSNVILTRSPIKSSGRLKK